MTTETTEKAKRVKVVCYVEYEVKDLGHCDPISWATHGLLGLRVEVLYREAEM